MALGARQATQSTVISNQLAVGGLRASLCQARRDFEPLITDY